jgi:KipI family sensor histidine kinase inhibitor
VEFECERMGEHALLLRFGAGIDRAVNACVHEACARLRAAAPDGLQELVPAYASVLLRFEPRVWRVDTALDGDAAATGDAASERLLGQVRAALAADGEDRARVPPPFMHRLPVCYGGAYGMDLASVAGHLRLDPLTVIASHCAAEYTVAMLGFAPGFAYLLGMDAGLAVPRLDRPRTRVPAGSVGIGGAQTGIYPAELPGGWQLIGRTPWALFDPANGARPCRFAPGDRVRFEAIDADAFDELQRQGACW